MYKAQGTGPFGCKAKHSIYPIPNRLSNQPSHMAYYKDPFTSDETCSFKIRSPLLALTLPNPASPATVNHSRGREFRPKLKIKQTKKIPLNKQKKKQKTTSLR